MAPIVDDIFKGSANVLAGDGKPDEVFSEEAETQHSYAGTENPAMWLSRGFHRKSYRMTPYVFRDGVGDEHSIFTEVLRTHFDKEFNGLTDLEILCKMQHYGVPTRLMDFTSIPLIASFFALSSLDDKFPKLKSDDLPKVVAVPVLKDELADFYSDRVAYLSSIPRLTDEEQKQLFDDALRDLTIQLAVNGLKLDISDSDLNISYRNAFRFAAFKFMSLLDEYFDSLFAEHVEKKDEALNSICTLLKNELNRGTVRSEFENVLNDAKGALLLRIYLTEKITADHFLLFDTDDSKSIYFDIFIGKNGFDVSFCRSGAGDVKLELFVSAIKKDNNLSLCYISEIGNNSGNKKSISVMDSLKGHGSTEKHMPMLMISNKYVSKPMERLYLFARRFNPNITMDFNPFDIFNGVFVLPPETKDRFKAQHGSFALFGLSRYWNVSRALESLQGMGARYDMALKVITDNKGFVKDDNGLLNDNKKISELEREVFRLKQKVFSMGATGRQDVVDGCQMEYLQRLSLAGYDQKSLGCSMSCTYVNMKR